MKALHLIIRGQVQGVGYRNGLERTATRLSLAGWVRNRSDGSVEALIEGNDADIDRALKWCWQGPVNAYVITIDETATEPAGLIGFQRRPTI
jgi:acylphosphatase